MPPILHEPSDTMLRAHVHSRTTSWPNNCNVFSLPGPPERSIPSRIDTMTRTIERSLQSPKKNSVGRQATGNLKRSSHRTRNADSPYNPSSSPLKAHRDSPFASARKSKAKYADFENACDESLGLSALGASLTAKALLSPRASQRGSGIYHTRSPTTRRQFQCDECIQSFNRNHDLKRHKVCIHYIFKTIRMC